MTQVLAGNFAETGSNFIEFGRHRQTILRRDICDETRSFILDSCRLQPRKGRLPVQLKLPMSYLGAVL